MKRAHRLPKKVLIFFISLLGIGLFCVVFSALIVTPLWFLATRLPHIFTLIFLSVFLFLFFYGIYKRVQKKQ